MSSSSSPCAACKLLRRKCTQECVFAPYFPADQPQKFANVHKVFGASNVAKLLSELSVTQREDAVNSLAYEADYRLRDPVYGCVGLISILKHRLQAVHSDLQNAKKELASYIGPSAMLPLFQHPTAAAAAAAEATLAVAAYAPPLPPNAVPYNLPMLGLQPGAPPGPSHPIGPGAGAAGGGLMMRDQQQQYHQHHHHQLQHQQQQMLEAQQLAAFVASREQQELMRRYEQQQQQLQQQQHPPQQSEFVRFNGGGFNPAAAATTSVTSAGGYSQMAAAGMSPSLALGSYEANPYQIHQQQLPQQQENHPHHTPSHVQFQSQLMLRQPQHQAPLAAVAAAAAQPQHQRSGSEEGKGVGPSC